MLRLPFLVLTILVICVYACLILYNYSSWKVQYYEDRVYEIRPLVYTKNVKIQEDKRKIFPERDDIFAQIPTITLDPIRRVSNKSTKKCSTFDAYIYSLKRDASPLAHRLYKQLTLSRYAVNESDHSCVLVAVLDNSSQLENLTFLKNRKDDHIIYLLNGTLDSIQHLFSSDIFGSNGVFLNVENEIRAKWKFRRLVTSNILQIHVDKFDMHNPAVGCETKASTNKSKCVYSSNIEDITLNQANFIYIGYAEARKFHTAFYATLLSGAIPIISGYNLNMLPLSEFIEWDSVVVRIPPKKLYNILDYLEQLDESQILEMKRKGKFYFRNYLADTKALIRSTLSAVRYRLQIPAPLESAIQTRLIGSKVPDNYSFKQGSQNMLSPYTSLKNAHFVYNIDPTFLDIYSPHDSLWQSKWMSNTGPIIPHWTDKNSGIKYSLNLNGNMPDEEFTIILNSFKRDEQLKSVLQRLNGIRFLRYVIVLWADVKRKPPSTEYWPLIHVPIHFVLCRNNSLNERFLPYDLIETEAVFSMDDDFEASKEHIEFMFRVWRENRDVLVGPNERLGYTDPITKRGVYKFEHECRYNIILTSGAFLHRNYLFAYWNTMPSEILEWVDRATNCEDIAMNFLISHLTRKPPIKVTPIFRTEGSLTRGVGLSRRREHKWDREKCLQVFEEIYGYNPLLLSETRIDSSHFLHPGFQCFKDT